MANYIVCLAHFCELHGPSIIICTQVTTPDKKSEHILPSPTKLQTCASCKLILPDDRSNLISSSVNKKDDTTDIYISTQYPGSQRRFTSLTKLVMKSLSVETSSDLTKPMLYGDTIYGYCMHKIFKIKDVNARGGERKYSYMVVSDSESDLLLNWNIISINVNEIINLIQKQVELTMKKPVNSHENSGILDGRYLRRSIVKPKSIVELTDDDQIFVKFHLWAIELLKDICM